MEETITTFRRKLKELKIDLNEEQEKELKLKIQKILNTNLKKLIKEMLK